MKNQSPNPNNPNNDGEKSSSSPPSPPPAPPTPTDHQNVTENPPSDEKTTASSAVHGGELPKKQYKTTVRIPIPKHLQKTPTSTEPAGPSAPQPPNLIGTTVMVVPGAPPPPNLVDVPVREFVHLSPRESLMAEAAAAKLAAALTGASGSGSRCKTKPTLPKLKVRRRLEQEHHVVLPDVEFPDFPDSSESENEPEPEPEPEVELADHAMGEIVMPQPLSGTAGATKSSPNSPTRRTCHRCFRNFPTWKAMYRHLKAEHSRRRPQHQQHNRYDLESPPVAPEAPPPAAPPAAPPATTQGNGNNNVNTNNGGTINVGEGGEGNSKRKERDDEKEENSVNGGGVGDTMNKSDIDLNKKPVEGVDINAAVVADVAENNNNNVPNGVLEAGESSGGANNKAEETKNDKKNEEEENDESSSVRHENKRVRLFDLNKPPSPEGGEDDQDGNAGGAQTNAA